VSQEYAFFDTMSGAFLAWATPATFSYNRALNESGTGQATFTADSVSRDLLTPWGVSLMAIRGGIPVGGGLIISVTADISNMMWTVRMADVRTILGRRTTFGTNGYSGNTTDNKLALEAFSLFAMPSWLVWAGTDGTTANFSLPIFLPQGRITYALINSLPKSGNDSRVYFDYEVHFVDDALTELQGAGLELDFEPRLSATNSLEWLLRISSTRLGGSTVEFNMTAVEQELFDVSYVSDGSKQSNIMYAIGKGSELDMRVTSSSAPPTGPALERAENYKDIDDLNVLKRHSNADLALYNKSTVQWQMSMLADGGKGKAIQNIRLGSTIRLFFNDHPMVPNSWMTMRLIGYSGDEGNTVKLQIQPLGA
jgi:hypothetical protein